MTPKTVADGESDACLRRRGGRGNTPLFCHFRENRGEPLSTPVDETGARNIVWPNCRGVVDRRAERFRPTDRGHALMSEAG